MNMHAKTKLTQMRDTEHTLHCNILIILTPGSVYWAMYFLSLSSREPASVLLLMDPVLLALSLMSPLLLPKNADPEAEALLALAGAVAVEVAEVGTAPKVVAGAAEARAGAAGSSRSAISNEAAASAAVLS
jgi:hypothetical protein